MADRFSRFNEDRDFQVNTGVAEDPGKALAKPEPFPPPLPALFPSRFCSGLRAGSLFSLLRFLRGPPGLRRGRISSHPVFSYRLYSGRRFCGFGLFGLLVSEPRPVRGWRPVLFWVFPACGGAGLGSPGKRGLGREDLERVLLRPGIPNPWILLARLSLRVLLRLSSF